MMEYTPLIVGAAVGTGAGLIDRSARSLEPNHVQLLYRAGGLLAALYAQSKRMGPPNVAPAAVTAFAASLAGRATALFLEKDLSHFGMTASGSCTSCGQVH